MILMNIMMKRTQPPEKYYALPCYPTKSPFTKYHPLEGKRVGKYESIKGEGGGAICRRWDFPLHQWPVLAVIRAMLRIIAVLATILKYKNTKSHKYIIRGAGEVGVPDDLHSCIASSFEWYIDKHCPQYLLCLASLFANNLARVGDEITTLESRTNQKACFHASPCGSLGWTVMQRGRRSSLILNLISFKLLFKWFPSWPTKEVDLEFKILQSKAFNFSPTIKNIKTYTSL